MKNALRKAITATAPVMAGYVFLGTAYGISMHSRGFGIELSTLISMIVYGGSLQFAMVDYLTQAFAPVSLLLLTVLIQARHLFYGISMLGEYQGTGKCEAYLIFALTDETYSLVCMHPPENVSRSYWYTAVSALDQAYWVLGTILGAAVGQMIPIDYLTGIDFSMTALFLVIVTNQMMDTHRRSSCHEQTVAHGWDSTALGGGVTLICLLVFGEDLFMIIAMIAIIFLFYFMYRYGKGKKA